MIQETPMIPCIRLPEMSLQQRRNDKHNSGRWKPIEHEKFIEAIIVHGNDWKLVQKCIKSRSSTQARSHAQKFLLKLRKKLKIEPENSTKLAKESIDKIVKEILDASSQRNNPNVDREKLVKLILGFSNLLVGKVGGTNNANIENSGGNFFASDGGYFDGNLNFPQNFNFFNSNLNFSENGKKVFNIEKVFKADRKNSVSVSTSESSCNEISFSPELLSNHSTNKPSFQINQIHNQNDLLKYLFQPPNQDPANPNKNVINIISINICNKNEAEQLQSSEGSGLDFLSKGPSDPNAKKTVLNIINAGNLTNNPISAKTVSSSLAFNKINAVIKNQKLVSSESEGFNMTGASKTAVSSSPKSRSFEQDFYENSNSSTNFFNQARPDEEEYDKYFEWN